MFSETCLKKLNENVFNIGGLYTDNPLIVLHGEGGSCKTHQYDVYCIIYNNV